MLYRLREGGYQAFLVGGCVRDLLIGLEPKDFDVATDALPEDVKKLFRNCRLIGRRFRLAHVFFGRETIEVATFRAAAAPEPGEETPPEIEADDADSQPLESAEDFEAEIAAELDDEEGGEGGEDEDFIDTVTLLPDEVMQADLVEDPIEKTAVMPAPPPSLMEHIAAADPESNSPTMVMPALREDATSPDYLAAARARSEAASRSDAASHAEGAARGGRVSHSDEASHAEAPTHRPDASESAHGGHSPHADDASSARASSDPRTDDPRHPASGGPRRDRRDRRDRFDEDADTERVLDTHGRILRDNVYGSIDEDVWRRDFTANSLYYNIADFSLWDYVGGAEDIAARRLRLIGDPETRFREDPVRMLRAARFEAKLNFEIEPATAAPITNLRGLLAHVPPARLFDETLKLFLSGHGARSLEVLRRRGLLDVLLPATASYLNKHPDSLVEKVLVQGLKNTDERALAGKPVTPTYLFALLLYGPIAREIESSPPQHWHELHTILEACDRAVREAQKHMSIPRRFSLGLREMFALQPRLEHPRGRRALRVLEHPRFRAAYDLLLLRAEHGLASMDTAKWWTRIQEVSPDERARMADDMNPQGGPPRPTGSRRGPRRRRRGGGGGGGGGRRGPNPS